MNDRQLTLLGVTRVRIGKYLYPRYNWRFQGSPQSNIALRKMLASNGIIVPLVMLPKRAKVPKPTRYKVSRYFCPICNQCYEDFNPKRRTYDLISTYTDIKNYMSGNLDREYLLNDHFDLCALDQNVWEYRNSLYPKNYKEDIDYKDIDRKVRLYRKELLVPLYNALRPILRLHYICISCYDSVVKGSCNVH